MWANWRDNIVLTSPYNRIISIVVIMEHKRLQLQLYKSIWLKSNIFFKNEIPLLQQLQNAQPF